MSYRMFSGTLNKSLKRFGVILPACNEQVDTACSHFTEEKDHPFCVHAQYLAHSETFEEATYGYFCRHVNAFCLAQEADSIRKLEEI